MNARYTAAIVVVAGLLIGGAAVSCGPGQTPEVPVYASPIDLTLLAGRWSGEFAAADGRRGHVVFELRPGERDAAGEIYVYPGAEVRQPREGYGDEGHVVETQPASPPIPIEFIWTENGQIQGRSDHYRDPELGSTLQAEFRGTWTGGVAEGTFASLEGGRTVREGWWRAVRTGGEVEGAPGTLADVPSHEELVALGRTVFETRGCAACHGSDVGAGADATPALEAVVEHRTFPWIFHMVVSPDSMLREDPTAMALGRRYETAMRDVDVTPWEALLLYEYLQVRAAERRPLP